MEIQLLERLRQGLLVTRSSLSAWLRTTTPDKKSILLGPASERAVQNRLEAVDHALAKAGSGSLGKCEVCHDDVEPEILEVDYSCCVCIDHLSDKERRQLEYELELAQNIQKMQLPQQPPQIPGLEVAAYSRPSQFVGGDYFDFVRFENGSHGLIIADVAGHGISSSLLVAGIQALLNALAPTSASPAEVVGKIHRLLIHNFRYSTFVSFFVAEYDSESKTLNYCNAGHPPPLLIRDGGQAESAPILLSPTAAAIGLVEDPDFGENRIALKRGDTLVMYTDGVTEAVDGRERQFGRQRLAQAVEQLSGSSAREVVGQIRKRLDEFSRGRPFDDDMTIVVGKLIE